MDVINDGYVDIAVGRSRREMYWRNREILWSALVDKFRRTHRTSEILSEYRAASKSRQDEIKDIGGFVGGYVNGGRRKKGNITHRQLVTLDIDFATMSIWGDFTMFYSNAAALYSTHKHCEESPRLRLIIPLDRPVGADEYIAIARKIAGNLGINGFDDTTYEPERLMYWPSSAKDGDYVFECQDGEWLCADEILGSYKDWKDSSQWPVSDRSGEVLRRGIKQQGDPLEKPGILGAFCRAYDIHSAIETFLSEVYVACDVEGRYTYKDGSTSGGLVVYDGLYAYSHHSTDPASGRLCNAFDLVRLNKFQGLDDNTKEGTVVNKLPSFMAMSDLASQDKIVKSILNRDRVARAAIDFGGGPGSLDDGSVTDDVPVDESWADDLDVDRKGVLKGSINNYELILRGDPKLKGRLKYNEFRNIMEVAGSLPWRKRGDLSQWKDSDDAALRSYVEQRYETLSRSNLADALSNIYEENRYHPVREFLKALVWDGVPRVETLFIDYLGAEDNQYVRTVTRKSLVAAVARTFTPGTKFDNVIVLVGPQGVGKSTVLRKIGKSWFSDNFHAVQGKDAIEQIQGVWIMEIGELAGLKKAEIEAIKSYISTTEDRCRLAYAKRVESFPRQCVFFGTTNKMDFLSDVTGNRRFWPIIVGDVKAKKSIFDDLSRYGVDQLWAEALCLHTAGETLYLDATIAQIAHAEQENSCEIDDRVGIVAEFLDIPLPKNWEGMTMHAKAFYFEESETRKVGIPRSKVCIAEIWCECFRGNRKDLDRKTSNGLHNIMRQMQGWAPVKSPIKTAGYGLQRGYKKRIQTQ